MSRFEWQSFQLCGLALVFSLLVQFHDTCMLQSKEKLCLFFPQIAKLWGSYFKLKRIAHARFRDRLLVLGLGAGAGAVSWLCAWWRQVAGAGAGRRAPVLALELVLRGGDRLLLPALVLDAGSGAGVVSCGAGCRAPGAGAGAVSWTCAWCCELAVRVVETGCRRWCCERGGDRLLTPVLGAGRRCWCLCWCWR